MDIIYLNDEDWVLDALEQLGEAPLETLQAMAMGRPILEAVQRLWWKGWIVTRRLDWATLFSLNPELEDLGE